MIKTVFKSSAVMCLVLLFLLASNAQAGNIVRVLGVSESLPAQIHYVSAPIYPKHGSQALRSFAIRVDLQSSSGRRIGHRFRQTLVISGGDRRGYAPLWFNSVTISVPRRFLAGSWDVRSLQRELERLGVKVKPKPAAPKPGTQVSS